MVDKLNLHSHHQLSSVPQTITIEKDGVKRTYEAMKTIGNGTFGIVYQAKVIQTEEIVAIKRVFQDKKYKNRELEITQELEHINCINLKN